MKIIFTLFLFVSFLNAQPVQKLNEPRPIEYVYKVADSTSLSAFVFFPTRNDEHELRSAVLVFHGGGWNEGTPEWAFSRGRHFVKQGLISVAVEYRLSDQINITPLDAMEDAIDAVRWVRSMSEEFGVDNSKVAVYGWSAGGHLAVSTAIFNNDTNRISSMPNAILLVSPALDLVNDDWVNQLLAGKTDAKDISPADNVRTGLPPTIIVHGRTDTLTPLDGIKLFTNRMREAGNICELHVYDGVGHMFTPMTESDRGWPNPDQEIKAEAYTEIDLFLCELDFGNKPY